MAEISVEVVEVIDPRSEAQGHRVLGMMLDGLALSSFEVEDVVFDHAWVFSMVGMAEALAFTGHTAVFVYGDITVKRHRDGFTVVDTRRNLEFPLTLWSEVMGMMMTSASRQRGTLPQMEE